MAGRPRRVRPRIGPRALAGLAGAVAALVSCWPVVFAGRSFVSPLNGGEPLLYDRSPFLPGYPAQPVARMIGSDFGAMQWAFIPYSAVEHRALLRDHAFPWWNRFNACGVALAGQGVSMIGDPLQWIPVAAGGAAWAWDVKFVLAKMLFGAGAGLAALAATGSVAAAVLTAVAAPWSGVFSWRFNHPAFFAVCYAPWILVGWLGLAGTRTRGAATRWIVLLGVTAWMELNSGAVKEAAMLTACLNAAGAAALLASPASRARRTSLLALAAAGAVIWLLLGAPLWLVFLDTLRDAWTLSDAPVVRQLNPAMLLGFFDDLFYRRVTTGEWTTNPSANLVTCFGVLWFIAAAVRGRAGRCARVLGASALVPCALAFGWVPAPWLLRLPVVRNLVHVDNTFSCVLLVLLLVPAAEGFRACLDAARSIRWRSEGALAGLAGILLLYAYWAGFEDSRLNAVRFGRLLPGPDPGSSWWWRADAVVLGAGMLALPWSLRRFAAGGTGWLARTGIAFALAALLARHGMYTWTPSETLGMAPRMRLERGRPSAALALVPRTDPGRVAGLEGVALPGYLGERGFEGPFGPDAVMNRRYRELTVAEHLDEVWGWRPVLHRSRLPGDLRVLDALNVRAYLATPEGPTQPRIPGLRAVARRDLDLYESPTAWPRAFWTDRLVRCDSATSYVALLRGGDGRPFAAVATGEPAGGPAAAAMRGLTGRCVAAEEYHLATNDTSFTVQAPAAGVIVLLEAWAEGEFTARVNGAPARLLRVNHAFKGVRVSGPGVYRVTISCRPRRLTIALGLATLGLAAAGIWAWRLRRGTSRL